MSEPNRQYHQALSANRKLLAENARLKAEVEQLTKAGDDMADKMWPLCGCQDCEEIIDCWGDAKRAAKEGKGQP